MSHRLRVVHAQGESHYDTTTFDVDDNSAVLLVYADEARKQVLAAFNREFWVTAEFEEVHDGPYRLAT